MKKKDNVKWLYYFIAIGLIGLFLLLLLSSVLNVGERITTLGVPYLDIVFYALVVLLVYLLLIRPITIIVFSPSFSIETTLEKTSKRNFPVYKKVAKRLLENKQLPDEQKQLIKENIRNFEGLQTALGQTYNNHIKKQINKIIKNNAKTVMISTAISQNGRFDSITVAAVNLKMIKEIVELCGFRPSFKNLSKLTINVFSTALIAEGLENMDIGNILPANTISALADIPLVKPLISSVTQGVSNALLTLRVGIITRKFLFSDAKEITKYDIRKGAFLEAAGMLPSVIGDSLVSFPKQIMKIFSKKKEEPEEKEKPNKEKQISKK